LPCSDYPLEKNTRLEETDWLNTQIERRQVRKFCCFQRYSLKLKAEFHFFNENIKKGFLELYRTWNRLDGGFGETEGLLAESSEAHKS
jgi:hypothetical protein